MALALAGGVVAGVLGGAPAALGVVVGAVTVVAVFSFGMALTHAAATVTPRQSLLVALLTYGLQLVVLLLVLTALEGSDALGATLDRGWIGGTIIVGTLVWTAALVRLDTLYHRPAAPVDPSVPPSSEGRH